MDIETLSPSYYGEDRIALGVDPSATLLAGRPVTIAVDYSETLPEGPVLPLVFSVQPAFGDGSGYVERTFTRVRPTALSFTPNVAGDYLVTLRESAHNRWQGRLLVRVTGDKLSQANLGLTPGRSALAISLLALAPFISRPDNIFGDLLSIWWRPDPQLVVVDSGGGVIGVADKIGSGDNIGDVTTIGGATSRRPLYDPMGGPNGTPALLYSKAATSFSPVHLTAIPLGSALSWFIVARLPMGVDLSRKVATWRIGSGGDFTAQFLTDTFSVGGPYQSWTLPHDTDTALFHNFVFAPTTRGAANLSDPTVSDGGIGGGNASGANSDLVLCEWCWTKDVPSVSQISAWNAYVENRYGI